MLLTGKYIFVQLIPSVDVYATPVPPLGIELTIKTPFKTINETALPIAHGPVRLVHTEPLVEV